MTEMKDKTDSQLLNAFADARNEAAFAELVRRHGPLVWSVCHRVLGRTTDVEDAAQATFLALAKQAPRWQPSRPAAPWLHRVAHNIALNVLRSQKTRERREKEAAAMNQRREEDAGLSREQGALLHEELDALPKKYRQALILFHLEGKSLQQTAEIMTSPTSTVGNWLARGREQLRARLARRGLILSLAVLTSSLSAEVGAAELPATFVTSTTAAAALFVAEGAGAGAGLGAHLSKIAPLAEGELRKMSYAKLPIIVATVILLLVVGTGIGWAFKGAGENTPVTQGDKSHVITDPVVRNYPASFEELLSKLESAEPGKLPSEKAGKLEVTLWADQQNSYRVSLDTSKQVYALSIPEDTEFDFDEKGPTKRSAPLAASVAAAMGRSKFRSASMLAFKAKQFDDGLYAAVEYAVNKGTDRFAARPTLLADLAKVLKAAPRGEDTDKALGLLGAATKLGGNAIELHKIAATHASTIEQDFLDNPRRSKPIGFYTWSQELSSIFQRDRLLQTILEPGPSRAFARALGSNADLFKRYQAELRLPARLTNGFAFESLATAANDLSQGKEPVLTDLALFPPSRAYETDLVKKLYGNSPIPDGFNLADEMIRRIQSGALNLKPGKDSGWYDHQTFALEPLVVPDKMPEARHLDLHSSYKKELIKLFKALLALTRETHIKQLEMPACGEAAPPPGIILDLYPQLSQEPLATFYLRRALAYRFVRGVLLESFGETGIAGMKRVTAAGPVNLTLDRELRAMESLFYGAYLNSAHELGMTPEAQEDLGLGAPKSLALYRGWDPNEDPDVSRDMRCMVPVFYDLERKKSKVWVVLGVATRPLCVRYAARPRLEAVIDVKSGKPVDLAKVELQFEEAFFTVAYPVMAEVYVSKILNRKEFRDLCDKHKTQEAILSQLE